MDLIRHILLEVEKGDGTVIQRISLPNGVSEETYAYHVALMRDAGLLDAVTHGTDNEPHQSASIIRMTWFGHDFLDSVRDNSVWLKAKEHVLKPAASWSFSVLLEWLKIEIRQRVSFNGFRLLASGKGWKFLAGTAATMPASG